MRFTYIAFQKAKDKGADQSSRMGRLVCAFVVRKPRRQVFSCCDPSHKIVILWNMLYFFLHFNDDSPLRQLVDLCVYLYVQICICVILYIIMTP